MSDIDTIDKLVSSISLKGIGEIAALFMYQGFSPEMVMEHLAKVKAEGNISDSDFQRDIQSLIIMGAVMGNYNEHNSGKISEEGKKKADTLMQKYGLKKGGIGSDKRQVNIPRLLAAFPIATTRVLMKCPSRSYTNAFECNSLPTFLKNPVFPSLIPGSLDTILKAALSVVATCYSAEQTMALKKMTDASQAYEQQKQYTEIAFNSSRPTTIERQQFLRQLQFPVSNINTVLRKFKEITKKDIAEVTEAMFTSAGLTTTFTTAPAAAPAEEKASKAPGAESTVALR